MKFYAVRSGRRPGIYRSWNDCEAQVKGYSRNEYKSFHTYGEAMRYMNEGENDNGSSQVCVDYLKGNCDMGSSCNFAHKRNKRSAPTTPLCKYYMQGNCLHGDNCYYEHPPMYKRSNNVSTSTGLRQLPPAIYDSDDSDDIGDGSSLGQFGMTHDDEMLLVCQGIKPHDDDAFEMLKFLKYEM
ncbi:ribonuclease H [Acrasis kona]|uniref:Ribonuclease H n=1 Tax=Acrasis kona TaxID=1008807 RepID=A0AAW2Z005_9EUKA